ncbi:MULTISPECIES: hypothetical protein [Enterobacteriaceae]|uniref:Uncharacterized protein n=1 Tax=Myoviridae sp. ct4xW4 TaxID=2826611 RepID=A0A8S5QYZ2_9CAUD|nr:MULTISPECIES: hypothetical protein [Enterobacteriaceae]DAE24430.1 MAG TPA: protein of unknown function (DUF4731) [Myoviridae sp. ct4xW4]
MKFVSWLGKTLVWFLAHALEGTITVAMSFMALYSLFVFDNIAMKVAGFVGSFAIGYITSYLLGMVRGEHRR